MGLWSCSEYSRAKAVCVVDEDKTMDPASLTNSLQSLHQEYEEKSTKTDKDLEHSMKRLRRLEGRVSNGESKFDKLSSLELQVKLLESKIENLTDVQDESKKTASETSRLLHEMENEVKKLQTWAKDYGDIKPEVIDNIKEMDNLKKKFSTSYILHWTTLGMVGALIVVLGFMAYRNRRIVKPDSFTRETSVAYVAGEDRLDMNHPGSSSSAVKSNFKSNNLYQNERDNCGAP